MYAIVRAAGRQEKVAVGDTITVDLIKAETGSSVALPAVLFVDGASVTSDPEALAKISVTAEIVGGSRGPKIHILRYKNKTGYRRRQGHRSKLTELRVTDIAGPGIKKASAAKSPAAKSTAAKAKPAPETTQPAAEPAGTDAE